MPDRLSQVRVNRLFHCRQEFVGRPINLNSEPLQRLQARDAGGVVEIEPTEICQPFQRLQARDAGGVKEIERAKSCQPFQRLQAREF